MNSPSGCWVSVITRLQEHLLRPWARPCDPDGEMTMTLHIYRPKRFQWALFEVNRSSGCWIMARQGSNNAYYAHGYAHVTLVGKLPRPCTSRGEDYSNELDLVVTEFRCPQTLGWPEVGTDGRTNGRTGLFHNPHPFSYFGFRLTEAHIVILCTE